MWEHVHVERSSEPGMSQSDLRNVAKALAKLRRAEREFRAMILRAHESGEVLRDIAERAELSHQRIHEIVRQEKRRQAADEP